MLECYRSLETEQTPLACRERKYRLDGERDGERLKNGKNGQLLHFPLRCAGLFHLFAESFREWGEIHNPCILLQWFPKWQLSRGCCSECSAKMADLFTGRRPEQFFIKCQIMTKPRRMISLRTARLQTSRFAARCRCDLLSALRFAQCAVFFYMYLSHCITVLYIPTHNIWCQCDLCAR